MQSALTNALPDLSDRPYHHTVTRRMRASPGAIYRAWTVEWDQWFARPGGVIMDARVDAAFFFVVEHEGARYPHYGRFLRLETDRLVEMTWVSGRGGSEGAETVLTVALEPDGDGTQVRLTHAGFYDRPQCDANHRAWPVILAHLDEILAGA